ncbi:unnamed protein product [Paramecium pentaurelia]|uniref:Uncharacterized protein n=1 Tax=Paramecium pentaurelia TaxID=43138 RepID=A0A8S1SMC2_9CILI|nr:unnamed protein product [Paramecium pentaurelia]
MFSIIFTLIFPINCATQIDIFIESQCPDTVRLFKRMKALLDYEQINQYVEFNFIPFGKGNEKLVVNQGYEFNCQHGNKECYGNLIDSCVLEQLDQIEQLRYLTCIHQERQNNEEQINLSLKRCVQNQECVYERTLKCALSKFGNYLQHKAAKYTLAQNLVEIPWININGQHIPEFDKKFKQNPLKAICEQIDCEKIKVNY